MNILNQLVIRGNESEALGFLFLGVGMEFPVTDFLLWSVSAEMSTPLGIKGVAVPITSRWYFRL